MLELRLWQHINPLSCRFPNRYHLLPKVFKEPPAPTRRKCKLLPHNYPPCGCSSSTHWSASPSARTISTSPTARSGNGMANRYKFRGTKTFLVQDKSGAVSNVQIELKTLHSTAKIMASPRFKVCN